MQREGKCPEFDVLCTNPPFSGIISYSHSYLPHLICPYCSPFSHTKEISILSGDHLEQIFEFAVASRKPWLLLMPQYVARKAFFLEWMNSRRAASGACRPTFLGPAKQPYVFAAPAIRPDVRSMREDATEGSQRTDGVRGSEGEGRRVAAEQHSEGDGGRVAVVQREGDEASTPSQRVAEGATGIGDDDVSQRKDKPADAFQVAAGSFQASVISLEMYQTVVQVSRVQNRRTDNSSSAVCSIAVCVVCQPGRFASESRYRVVPKTGCSLRWPHLCPCGLGWGSPAAKCGSQAHPSREEVEEEAGFDAGSGKGSSPGESR